jgi:hypothetical protein
MPKELKEVHQKLDMSVKEIYLIDEESNNSQIMSKLFNLIKKTPGFSLQGFRILI